MAHRLMHPAVVVSLSDPTIGRTAPRHTLPLTMRVWAAVLVVLCASPFTAPFSTCDFGTLLTGHHTGVSAQAPTPVSVDDAPGDAGLAMDKDENTCELVAPHATLASCVAVVAAVRVVRAPAVRFTAPLPLRL